MKRARQHPDVGAGAQESGYLLPPQRNGRRLQSGAVDQRNAGKSGGLQNLRLPGRYVRVAER